MNTTLLTAGIVLIAAGIVGGGLKLLGNEIPLLASKTRQVLLAVFGVILIGIGYLVGTPQANMPIISDPPGDSAGHTPPNHATASDSVVPPSQPPATTSLSLSYLNAPEYVIPGSETLVHINAVNQNRAAQQNAYVILTSPAGTILKPFTGAGNNNNIIAGYTDAEGNFAAYFVCPQSKAQSFPLQIEASVDQITASGSLSVYSQAWAIMRHIEVRPQATARFQAIPVRITKRTK